MQALFILAALAVGAGLLMSLGGSAEAAAAGHVVSSRGWVETDPRTLASRAGVSDSTYALASAMVSEAGQDARAQTAVGWALRNHADERGESVFRVLTRAGRNNKDTHQFEPHDSNGYFGPQNAGPRWASTRKPPTDSALAIASSILTGSVDDPTGGATQFDAPEAQDSLLGKVEGYVKSAVQIAEERAKGSDMVMIHGVDNIRFWVPRA